MIRKKTTICLCLLLFIGLTGCQALRRKFTRPPKKAKAKEQVVYVPKEYEEAYSKGTTYRNYFIYWKSWQQELIDCLGGGRKRQILCVGQIQDNLNSMKRHLKEEKQRELEPYIKRMKEIELRLRRGALSQSAIYRLKTELSRQMRAIEREFAYSKVKQWIK